jgi:hypothetical protein
LVRAEHVGAGPQNLGWKTSESPRFVNGEHDK